MATKTCRRKKAPTPFAPAAPGYEQVRGGDLDVLFLLLQVGPKVVQQMIGGDRPHHSSLWRWHAVGRKGTRLRCVSSPSGLLCCRRWVWDFLSDVAAR